MRTTMLLLALMAQLVGCATAPAAPPECSGPLVPINGAASS